MPELEQGTKEVETEAGVASAFAFNGVELRAVSIEGEPWFVVQDACRLLSSYIRSDGSVNTNAAVGSFINDDERKKIRYRDAKRIGLSQVSSRAHGLLLVSESGLYKMITRSDKPEAMPFQEWVTHPVLPALRKTGTYRPASMAHFWNSLRRAIGLP